MPAPCGCRRCGCMCALHSPTGWAESCRSHGGAILRFVLGDAAALVSLGLFLACLGVWASILGK